MWHEFGSSLAGWFSLSISRGCNQDVGRSCCHLSLDYSWRIFLTLCTSLPCAGYFLSGPPSHLQTWSHLKAKWLSFPLWNLWSLILVRISYYLCSADIVPYICHSLCTPLPVHTSPCAPLSLCTLLSVYPSPYVPLSLYTLLKGLRNRASVSLEAWPRCELIEQLTSYVSLVSYLHFSSFFSQVTLTSLQFCAPSVHGTPTCSAKA